MSFEPRLGLVSTCPCQSCATWRRIGEILGQGHVRSDFHLGALRVLRLAFNELLDIGVPPGGSLPVAAGGVPSAGAPPLPPEAPKGETGTPAAGGNRSPLPKPREKEEEKDRSRRRRRKEKDKKEEKRTAKPSTSRSHHSKRSRTQIKEESESEGAHRERSPEDKREKSPRSRSRSPTSDKRNVASPRSPVREPPPGQWKLRPRSPPGPPPRRPSAPSRPPSSWTPSGPSKGLQRRVRNADIHQYGPSQERKRWRENQHRG